MIQRRFVVIRFLLQALRGDSILRRFITSFICGGSWGFGISLMLHVEADLGSGSVRCRIISMEKLRGVPECVRNTGEGSGDPTSRGTLKRVTGGGVP